MSDINIDEAKLKALFKAAIIEVIEENQEFVREVYEKKVLDKRHYLRYSSQKLVLEQ